MIAERPHVVFVLGDDRYAVALSRVLRTIRVVAITPLPGAPAIVRGVVDVAGEVLPVIDMRRRFGQPVRALALSDHLILATTATRTVALLVDEVRGVLTVSDGQLAAARASLPGPGLIDGAVALADGLVLIHDLDRLLSLDEEAAIDGALAEAATHLGAADAGTAAGRSP